MFTVGQNHYEKLVKAFAKESCLADVIFIHPHSPKCMDVTTIDSLLTPIEENLKAELTLLEMEIHDPAMMDAFIRTLNEAIKTKLEGLRQVAPTVASTILTRATGLSFEAHVRPSMWVDAYHPLADGEKIEPIVEELDKKGIHGHFTFFKSKHYYCIPKINSEEVSSKIMMLVPTVKNQ